MPLCHFLLPIVALLASPALAAQSVTPTSGSTTASPNTSGNTAAFTVTTGGPAMFGWSVDCATSGQVSGCSAGTFNSNQQSAQQVTVTYSTGSAGAGGLELDLYDGMFVAAWGQYSVEVGTITYSVAVTPDGGSGSAYTNTTGNTTTFTVKNTGTHSDGFVLDCTPTAPVTTCTGYPDTLWRAAGDSTIVTVYYNTSGSTGSGGLDFEADGVGSSTAYDDGDRTISVTAPPVYGVAVAPSTGILEHYADGGMETTFSVENTGNTTVTFSFACTYTAVITSCDAPSPVAIGPSASYNANVSFGTQMQTYGTGTLRLIATSANAADTGVRNLQSGWAEDPLVTLAGAVSPDSFQTWDTVTFTVKNQTQSLTEQYTLGCYRSGEVVDSSCAVLDQPTLGPGQSAPVRVRFQRDYVGTGTIGLDASRAECCGPVREDSTSTGVTVLGRQHAPDIALERYNPHLHRDYGMCVTATGGPGVQVSCGTMIAAHAMPAYRTLGRDRALTLVYNSRTSSMRGTQAIRVEMLNTQAQPDSLRVYFQVKKTTGGGFVPEGSASYTSWLHSNNGIRQIVSGYNADSDSSGIYPFRVIVAAHYGGTVTQDTVGGELVHVNRRANVFGSGWWVGGVEQLVLGADHGGQNRVLWVGSDGGYAAYDSVSTGVWRRAPGAYRDTLVRVGGEYRRRLLHGDSVVYNSTGQHIRTRTRAGHVTTFTWTGTKLTSIAVPNGVSTYQLAYNGSNRLTSITDPVSRTLVVGRSGWNDTSFTDPDGAVTRFGYDGGRRVTRRTTPRNHSYTYRWGWGKDLNAVFDPFGDSTRVTWTDARGQTLDNWTGGIRGAAPLSQLYTVLLGPRVGVNDNWTFWEDMWGAPIRVKDPAGLSDSLFRENPSFPAIVTRWKAFNGRVVQVTLNRFGLDSLVIDDSPAAGFSRDTTRYEYDPLWRSVTRIVPPLLDSVTIAYDAGTGNRVWQQDARGASSRVDFRYNGQHLVSRIVVAGSAKDSLGYDSRGNLSRILTPHIVYGGVYDSTVIVNDTAGLPSTTTSPDGVVTTIVRSVSSGRDSLVSTSGPEREVVFSGDTVTWYAQSTHVRFLRDLDGNVTATYRWATPTVHDTLVDATRYDAVGRPVAVEATDGAVDSTVYDAAGNPVTFITRRGYQITQVFDVRNLLVQRNIPQVVYSSVSYQGAAFPKDSIPADTVRFYYDGGGRDTLATNRFVRVQRSYALNGALVQETQRLRAFTDLWRSPGDGTGFSQHVYVLGSGYDRNGRRTALAHPAQLGPGSDSTRFTYHSFGPLATIRDPYGSDFTFRYDSEGRLDSIGYPNYTGERIEYYNNGAIQRRTIRSNKPGQDACPVTGSRSCFPNDVIRADTIYYTRDGLMTGVYNAGREWFQYGYLGLGQLGYAVRAVTAGVTSFELFWPDALGNMMSRDQALGSESGTIEERYVYSATTGRLLSDTLFRPSNADTLPSNRVYSADGSLELEQTFQRIGHCVTGDVFYCAQAFAANAEVVSRYNYDAEGRQRTADRNVAVLTPPTRGQEGGLTRSYYDPYGRRVMRTWLSDDYSIGTLVRDEEYHDRFVWDGDQILYEVRAEANGSAGDNDNASTPELGRVGYVHGPGIDRPLESFRADGYFTNVGYLSDRLFLYADYRGSITLGAWTDGSQDRDRQVGQTIVPAFVDWTSRNQTTYRSRFVGFNTSHLNFFGSLLSEQFDGSKLQYLRNRFYDPQTGRFTQEDPIGIAGGLNVYGFGSGDPVNFSDPFGLMPCDPPDPSCEKESFAREVVGHARESIRNAVGSLLDGVGQVGSALQTAAEAVGGFFNRLLFEDHCPDCLTGTIPTGGSARGIVTSVKTLNVGVRGTREFARTLFRARGGSGQLELMRNYWTKRITGVRNRNGSAMYRPKADGSTNVEIINDNRVRVNIHIRP